MNQSTIINEFEPIMRNACRNSGDDEKGLTKEEFDMVEDLIEVIDGDDRDKELLRTYQSSIYGRTIVACNCIGVISFRNERLFDILPKFNDLSNDPNRSREMIMKILYDVFDIPFKGYVESNHSGSEMNMFEFFVALFINEVTRSINCGMRSSYILKQNNEKFFKGRILFSEHIRENYLHQERVFIEYETFSPNRPENRLLKTTMELLLKKTTNGRNKKNMKVLLSHFESVETSSDIDRDMDKCILDRNMVNYVKPLIWCKIFLKDLGFSLSSGNSLNYALLLRLDKLYEAYVAKMVNKNQKEGHGTFSQSYSSKTYSNNSDAAILIDISWRFFNNQKQTFVTDIDELFNDSSGLGIKPEHNKEFSSEFDIFRRTPPYNKIKTIAENYIKGFM